ncbi:MAG: hypothetical protein Q8L98_08010 [Chlamydiales bacterium]|nr:hypothetical protein [Chlamydiales bacterium]
MFPISPSIFFDPSEWEDSSQNAEALQSPTLEKSARVARDVFSSPFQGIEDGTLSDSWNFTERRLGPSDIQLEAVSYYEQGPFPLEELFAESGRKRKGSLMEEPPAPKRICISGGQEISSFLEPFKSDQSISQLDGLSQMVDPFEVFGFCREESMGGAAQASLESHEGFIQVLEEESVHIEVNEGVEERETLLEIIETSSPIERSEARHIEQFKEKDLIVLNAIHQNPDLGYRSLFTKLKKAKKITTSNGKQITQKQVESVFDRYDLSTKDKRTAARDAGWPGFKLLGSPTRLVPEKLGSLPGKRAVMRIDDSARNKISDLALQNPQWGCRKIGKEMSNDLAVVPMHAAYKILKEEGLNTPEKRREKAIEEPKQQDIVPETQDQTLSDLVNPDGGVLDGSAIRVEEPACYEQSFFSLEDVDGEIRDETASLSDVFNVFKSALDRSGISVEEPSSYEQSFFHLENIDGEIRDEVDFFESSEPIEQQAEIGEAAGACSEIEDAEQFNEEEINETDRAVLAAIFQNPLLGFKAVFNRLKDKVKELTLGQVEAIFKKYNLNNRNLRIEEAEAGWPRFNTPSLPKDPLPEDLSISSRADLVQTVIEFYAENPRLSNREIAEELTSQGCKTSTSAVGRILKGKQLPEDLCCILSRDELVKAVTEFYAKNPRLSRREIAEEFMSRGIKTSTRAVGRILQAKQP